MNPRTDAGIPKPKRGSPNPHTKMGIPEPKWGCASNESQNRFGDPRTEMGIKTSPYQNGYPRTKTGIPESVWGCESQTIPKPIRGSLNRFGDQYIPIPKRGSPNRFGDCSVMNQNRFGVRSNLGLEGFVPKLERHSKRGPHIGTGIPIPIRGLPELISKSGSPRIGMGLISIWGSTYAPQAKHGIFAKSVKK